LPTCRRTLHGPQRVGLARIHHLHVVLRGPCSIRKLLPVTQAVYLSTTQGRFLSENIRRELLDREELERHRSELQSYRALVAVPLRTRARNGPDAIGGCDHRSVF